MTTDDVKAALELCYSGWGVPELINITQVEFNNRLRRIGGDAIYYQSRGLARIRFSTKIFNLMGYDEQLNTVAHEAAHIADAYNHGYATGHGLSWKKLMTSLGFQPSVCHSINTRKLDKWYIYNCTCGKQWIISQNRASRLFNGTNGYICSKCKARFPVRASAYRELETDVKEKLFQDRKNNTYV